ncbi:MAG: hypothetical protein [Circoviridae sp.]|nr:MAG: hypothetical protein [Circoviridae sp.]
MKLSHPECSNRSTFLPKLYVPLQMSRTTGRSYLLAYNGESTKLLNFGTNHLISKICVVVISKTPPFCSINTLSRASNSITWLGTLWHALHHII